MSNYTILIHPDRRLRQRAATIEHFDDALQHTIAKMFTTMYESKGIGLAAVQVNILKRLFVMDITNSHAENAQPLKRVLINPEIINYSDEVAIYKEGCLSLPAQFADVTRPKHIRYRYCDSDGQTHEDEAEGLAAVCIQHEIDHLNGILFIDHLSRLKRERLEKKLAKDKKEIQQRAQIKQ